MSKEKRKGLSFKDGRPFYEHKYAYDEELHNSKDSFQESELSYISSFLWGAAVPPLSMKWSGFNSCNL